MPEKYIIQHNHKNDTFGSACLHDGLCGKDGFKFTSTGWPTQDLAIKRAEQHFNEHDTGEIMQPLHEFRNENGLNEDGTLRAGG